MRTSRWKMLMALAILLIAGLVGAAIMFSSREHEAQASVQRRAVVEPREPRDIQAEMDAWNQRFEAEIEEGRRQSEQLAEELAKMPPAKQPRRSLRRWVWESPEETRETLWHIPADEMEGAVVTGLLRICTSEAEGLENDCIGIWQVLNNIRVRSCNRGMYRLITECDDDGETMLSVMRRAQRFALGVVPARSLRSRWIAEMETTCDMPPSYPDSAETWERNHRRHCERTVALARNLIAGDYERITGANVIAWGGRCEDDTGACDDRLACSRGLARVELTTANAFWCRPGSTGCADVVDPICGRYAPEPMAQEVVAEAEANGVDVL